MPSEGPYRNASRKFAGSLRSICRSLLPVPGVGNFTAAFSERIDAESGSEIRRCFCFGVFDLNARKRQALMSLTGHFATRPQVRSLPYCLESGSPRTHTSSAGFASAALMRV